MTAKKKVAKKKKGSASGGKKRAARPELAIVEDIIGIMNEANLAEFSFEHKGLSIRLRRNEGGGFAPAPLAAPAPAPAPAAAPAAEASGKAEERKGNVVAVTSPMVGTFYRAPAPDADPFVDNGSVVKSDSVVCIVEAMKLMNEIKAETNGRIVKICVENGQPVEYGQELFLVEKS